MSLKKDLFFRQCFCDMFIWYSTAFFLFSFTCAHFILDHCEDKRLLMWCFRKFGQQVTPITIDDDDDHPCQKVVDWGWSFESLRRFRKTKALFQLKNKESRLYRRLLEFLGHLSLSCSCAKHMEGRLMSPLRHVLGAGRNGGFGW